MLGLDRCVDDILMPAMQQSPTCWPRVSYDAAQDLMATEAVRSWLNHRRSLAPTPLTIGPILLSCGPRDRQVVVLESLALLLRFRRWPCQVLGARISTFTLTIAAQAAAATGVVVASAEGRGLQHAGNSLRAVAALGIPVFYAGDAFETNPAAGRYRGDILDPNRQLIGLVDLFFGVPGTTTYCYALFELAPGREELLTRGSVERHRCWPSPTHAAAAAKVIERLEVENQLA